MQDNMSSSSSDHDYQYDEQPHFPPDAFANFWDHSAAGFHLPPYMDAPMPGDVQSGIPHIPDLYRPPSPSYNWQATQALQHAPMAASLLGLESIIPLDAAALAALEHSYAHAPIQPFPALFHGSHPANVRDMHVGGVPAAPHAAVQHVPERRNSISQSSTTSLGRTRTTHACEPCRKRKAKCNGGRPCERCHARGLDCQYSAERRMRGPNKPKPKGTAPPPLKIVDSFRYPSVRTVVPESEAAPFVSTAEGFQDPPMSAGSTGSFPSDTQSNNGEFPPTPRSGELPVSSFPSDEQRLHGSPALHESAAAGLVQRRRANTLPARHQPPHPHPYLRPWPCTSEDVINNLLDDTAESSGTRGISFPSHCGFAQPVAPRASAPLALSEIFAMGSPDDSLSYPDTNSSSSSQCSSSHPIESSLAFAVDTAIPLNAPRPVHGHARGPSDSVLYSFSTPVSASS